MRLTVEEKSAVECLSEAYPESEKPYWNDGVRLLLKLYVRREILRAIRFEHTTYNLKRNVKLFIYRTKYRKKYRFLEKRSGVSAQRIRQLVHKIWFGLFNLNRIDLSHDRPVLFHGDYHRVTIPRCGLCGRRKNEYQYGGQVSFEKEEKIGDFLIKKKLSIHIHSQGKCFCEMVHVPPEECVDKLEALNVKLDAF